MARSRLIPPPLLPSSVPNPLIFSTAACEKKDFSRSRLQTHSTFTNSPFPLFLKRAQKDGHLTLRKPEGPYRLQRRRKEKSLFILSPFFIPPPSSEATLAFFGKWKKVSTFFSHYSLCIPPPFFACSFPNTLSGFLAVKNPLALDLWCRTPLSFFPPNPFFPRANQQKRIETSPLPSFSNNVELNLPRKKGYGEKHLVAFSARYVCVCA